MSGVNRVTIVGRLGADPEIKTVSENSTVCKLSVATSEKWLKDGKTQERTEWHRIVVWNKLADLCGAYLVKGRQIYLEGKLQTRSWENDQGQKQYTTEIVANVIQFLGEAVATDTAPADESVLDHKVFDKAKADADADIKKNAKPNPGVKNHAPVVDNDDDLPF